MKIKTQLQGFFILTSLLPIFLVSMLFLKNAQSTLEASIEHHLTLLSLEKSRAIALLITNRIEEVKSLAYFPDFKAAVAQSNLKWRSFSHNEIQQKTHQVDETWIQSQGNTEIAQRILTSKLSLFLKRYQNRNPERYGEIFVTDAKGVVVAMTKILSDYYQADEEWWQKSWNQGRGEVFLDDRGYDKSVETIVVGVVVPILDKNEVIGILKINYKVSDILEIIGSIPTQHEIAFLIRSQGQRLASSKGAITHGLSEGEKRILTKTKAGWIKDVQHGKKVVMAYAPIPIRLYTRVPNPGEKKGISGEKWESTQWYFMTSILQHTAFAPISQMKKNILFIGIILVIVLIGFTWLLSYSITHPLKKLIKGVEILSQTTPNHIINLPYKNEIGQLANAFNEMGLRLKKSYHELQNKVEERTTELANANKALQATNKELKTTQAQLIQSGKLASLGEMSTGIAHELNQPLTIINMHAEIGIKHIHSGNYAALEQHINQIRKQIERASQIINHLKMFGRDTHLIELIKEDMNHIIENSLLLISAQLKLRNIKVRKALASDLLWVNCQPLQIEQVLTNLITNARDAMDSTAQKQITLRSFLQENQVVVEIEDTGEGIPKTIQKQIFDPFFTTKELGKGTGLGLSISYGIIQQYGGVIEVESEEGQGAIFRIKLPAFHYMGLL